MPPKQDTFLRHGILAPLLTPPAKGTVHPPPYTLGITEVCAGQVWVGLCPVSRAFSHQVDGGHPIIPKAMMTSPAFSLLGLQPSALGVQRQGLAWHLQSVS